MECLHLSGPVLAARGVKHAEAWVLDGRITYQRPAAAAIATTLAGVVVPGLVDMHCHVGLDTDGPVDQDTALAQAIIDRDAGTLLIRDAGSAIDTSFLKVRPDAPRLIRSGRFIARPKRYLRHYAREIDVDQLVEVVTQEARTSDGWVKIIADWIDREVGDLTPLWPDDVLAEAIAAAHAEGARVTAHTFTAEAVGPLLEAGIDCIEHGTGMTAEHMRMAAERAVPVVPTLLQVDNFAEYARRGEVKFPRYAARMRAMYENRYRQVRLLYDAGVTLLLGTDAGGTVAHGRLAAEASALVHAGLPADDAVAAATWTAREFLGEPSLGDGASADLVVLEDDPRRDISALADPAHVVLRGVRVSGTAAVPVG